MLNCSLRFPALVVLSVSLLDIETLVGRQTPLISAAVFDGKRLSISPPPGWMITRKPKPEDWKHSSCDFEIVPTSGRSGPVLRVAIMQWPISRAERNGFLKGTQFNNGAGLAGILTHETRQYGSAESSWWFTIRYTRSPRSVVLIYVKAPPDHRNVVLELYKTVQFVSPAKRS